MTGGTAGKESVSHMGRPRLVTLGGLFCGLLPMDNLRLYHLKYPELPYHPLVRVANGFHRPLSVVIEVDEHTTSAEIREAIPIALRWRDHLLEQQGPWIWGGDGGFLYELDRLHKCGTKPKELAEHINKRLAEQVKQSWSFSQESARIQTTLQTEAEYADWLYSEAHPDRLLASKSLYRAKGLLEAVRIEDNIDELLTGALARVEAGYPPFEKGSPVSAYRITATLKAWRLSRSGRIQVARDKDKRKPRPKTRL
jgi:hypothetical protein